MKEIQEIQKDVVKTTTEIQQQKTALQFRGTQNHIQGLTVWEFNIDSGILSKAKMVTNVGLDGAVRKEVTVSENSFIVQALNIKNATRKINKYGYQVKSVE